MRATCQESPEMAATVRVFSHLLPVVALYCMSASGHGMEAGRDGSLPNILFILVDDLGWADLGCYGNKFIETPFTDSLAGDGIRFTSAYTAPVCMPSRGMILSGQSSARTGLYKVPFQGNDRPWAKVVPPENWGYRPIDAKPLGAILSDGGYVSKLLGKVHVPKAFAEGLDGTTVPQKAKAALGETFHQKLLDFARSNPGKEVGPITRQAIEYIASNKDGPFFCYVGHHIPHIPLVAREELTRKYESKWRLQPADVHPHYAAMCEAMDDSVGLILEALDRLGLSDNTMVVFFSDNGGVSRCFNDGRGAKITDLGPLRGEKGGIYEGGIRVPLIVRWPGQVEPGSVCDTPVISTDFLPTFVEAAGITLPKKQVVDGISLVPLLRGRAGVDRERLFFYFPDYHHDFPGMAVRDGDYKLIESSEDGHIELYNLAQDVGEEKNLAARMPDKVSDLKKTLHARQKALGAKQATPNPQYDPWSQHLLDPDAEHVRQRYLPIPWPPGDSAAPFGRAAKKVPILYSTDLHHPHMDPDDHFDLATLFAMPEFDVRGIVLDCGGHQQEAPGKIPVSQILHLRARKVPYAIGLAEPLRSAADAGRDQPGQFQPGVRLILDALRESPEKLTVFTTGSLRDVAAAFNREPELLRRKIARLYINIGNPSIDKENRRYEYNVNLDQRAYVCIMQSGLPIYWCPCFDGTIWERGVHGTYWKFDQRSVLENAPEGLQNWIIFALEKPRGSDPIAFLSAPQDPAARTRVWKMTRNMWCTAPFIHAAGRRVYLRSEGDYVALPPLEARQSGLSQSVVNVFDFVPMKVAVKGDSEGAVSVNLKTDAAESNGYVFQGISSDYDRILTSCLKNLLADFEE